MTLPQYEDVKVNIDEEIARLAERDGISNMKLLDVTLQMTRRDYYRASIVQWYRGRDQGYLEGVVSARTNVPIYRLIALGFAIGALVFVPLTLFLGKH